MNDLPIWIAFLCGWGLLLVVITAVLGATARTRDFADRMVERLMGEGGRWDD